MRGERREERGEKREKRSGLSLLNSRAFILIGLCVFASFH